MENFSDLYFKIGTGRRFVTDFMTGNLAIEFLLRKLLAIANPTVSIGTENISNYRLIELNHKENTIPSEVAEFLKRLNSIRNKYAHEIKFEPSLADLKDLLNSAKDIFHDMTDGIEQGVGSLEEASSLEDVEEWVIPELFIQICYDLHNAYQEKGGDPELF